MSDFVEAVEGALHERMRGRVELCAAQRRGQPAHEIVRDAQPATWSTTGRVRLAAAPGAWWLPAGGAAPARPARPLGDLATPPGPEVAASSSARSAPSVPMLRSAASGGGANARGAARRPPFAAIQDLLQRRHRSLVERHLAQRLDGLRVQASLAPLWPVLFRMYRNNGAASRRGTRPAPA